MRYLSFLLVFGAGIVCGLAIVYFVISPRPPATVQVNIHNQTAGTISSVTVADQQGSVSLTSIAAGQATAVLLPLSGEGSLDIRATLEDGTEVTGHGGYVETGYTVKEVVTARGIEHEHVSF